MNERKSHICSKNHIVKRIFFVLALLLPGIPVLPHHHHGCDHLCMCVDDSHTHANTHSHSHRAETAEQCNTSCVTRFVYHRESQQKTVISPVLLLSFFISSLLYTFGYVLPDRWKETWVVRQGAFLPDDYDSGPFGWRAPPFS